MAHDRRHRVRSLAALVFSLALIAAACGSSKKSNEATGSTSGSSGAGGKIALLLPETKTARYETQDKPLFEAKVQELCANCEVLYSNADQDAAKQQSQAEAALTNGAKVLVLDPVDSASAAAIANKAKQQNVPVIAYDRLVNDAPIAYYISFDNEEVGKLQGTALVDKLKADGNATGKIVMINGSPTDNNAGQFKAGAHSVIDSSGVTVAAEFDTPDWSPDKAQSEMDQAITNLGKDGFVGVYAANDGTAGGAIAAMKGVGVTPIPPVTGQDAELAGVQRVLTGEQYMTVYKSVKQEVDAAATLAVALVRGEDAPSGLITTQVNNKAGDVPSVILTPVSVTKDKIKDTVVADGYWSAAQICTAEFATACTAAGIS
ncbi:MAG: ABC transporter substrate-binding protein [Acidimicrobiales bacterium]